MKHDRAILRAMRCLLAAGLLCGAPVLLADTAADCRQEAQDYGIPPEQAADYIDGCILSRGGVPDPAAAMEEVPVEDAVVDAPGVDDSMIESGQTDDEPTGGSDGAY